MNTEIALINKRNDLQNWDDKQIDLLKNTVAKGLHDDEFLFFAEVCKATGLNPLLRQIHCTIHKDQYQNRNLTIITGIDGIRKIAHSTGAYAGRDKAKFIYKEGKNEPHEVEVTVYKIVQGLKCSFTATAIRDEYLPSNPKKRFMWNKMKEWMLEKCAEAKALRMAFTQELSGIYEEGEAHQISDKNINEDVKDMNSLIKGLPEPGTVEKDVQHVETIEVETEEKKEPPQDENNKVNSSEAVEEEKNITTKQRQRLFAIGRSKKWKDVQVKEAMLKLTGIESTKDLTQEPYKFLVNFIQNNTPEALNEE